MNSSGKVHFSDDEPLPTTATGGQTANSCLQNVTMRAIPEHDAVPASESKPNFAVLVGLRAPPLSDQSPQARAPIDLVMVLDVSGSMGWPQLDLVKHATCFVVDNLGPSDRLSLVSFSTNADRILPLCRMTVMGQANAKQAVNSLFASGDTNIVSGLTTGLQVLEERSHRNPVASIMFLSDGQDNRSPQIPIPNATQPYLHLLPISMRLVSSNPRMEKKLPPIPIHTFGFGSDHDSLAMHAVARLSGGTFSFIESYDVVNDAFAKCIGGLLSVVVRDLRLAMRSTSYGVRINSVPSGNYPSEISASRGEITVGDLYADEEKEFLIDISIPLYSYNVEGRENENDRRTPLLDITCSYKDVVSNEKVEMESVEIRRPGLVLPSDVKVKVEVDRQMNRINATKGFAKAQRAAETGNLEGARSILASTRASIRASMSGMAGDEISMQLEADMKETEEKMECKRSYEQTGRAYALSSMSAHANQRATTRLRDRSGGDGTSGAAYVTPNMANIVNKSHQVIKTEVVKMEKD